MLSVWMDAEKKACSASPEVKLTCRVTLGVTSFVNIFDTIILKWKSHTQLSEQLMLSKGKNMRNYTYFKSNDM